MNVTEASPATPEAQLDGIEIRPARPDDRGPIAELIYSSGTDIYDYLFKTESLFKTNSLFKTRSFTALDFIRHEFASGIGFAGYKNVTVAIKEGIVVGTGCFYDRARYQKLVKGTGKNILDMYGWLGMVPVLMRARHSSSVMKIPKDGELYLANFGVDPTLRSHGIGSRMIQHKLAEARQLGYRTFGLDVSIANPRGQALYEKIGMKNTGEKAFSDPESGVANVRKMELSLQASNR
jgi:ribosomal protein S18 acetylase RimI-like enzyme